MKEKKYSFYEVDPRYFKDYSGDGIGDLAGLANKFDYFDYLGVDAIILKNLTAIESIKKGDTTFTKIAPEVGNANDLIRILSEAKKTKKRILIDLPIGYIKENHNWFKSAEDQEIHEYTDVIDFTAKKEDENLNYGYSSESKKYFVKDEKTQEVPLNWKSEQVLEHFLEVIRYWQKLGVDGFVFKDFEFLDDPSKQNPMSESTLKELRKFYRGIKEIDDNLIIVGRSLDIPLKLITEYTEGSTKVFDYFISEAIAELGTHSKLGHDAVAKFSPKKLAKDIKILANDPKNIITFNSENIGKVVSRWGNDVQFLEETAKSLAMLLHLTGASSSIYQGDEIGTPNIGLTHLDDFQDKDLPEKKQYALSRKITEKEFMDAQVLNGSINARALMAWDDSKNGGFSVSEKTITPPSTTFKHVNVKNQYPSNDSILNFTKELIALTKKPAYARIISAENVSVSSLVPGVIKYSLKDAKGERELLLLVNLTNKTKPIRKLKVGKVVMSSYAKKHYGDLPKSLEAYEGIIVSKQTDDFFKETQAIKIADTKEKERIKKEEEKIKIQEQKEAEAIERQKQKDLEEKAKAAQLEKERKAAEKAKAKEEAKLKAQQEAEAKAAEEAAKAQAIKEAELEKERQAKAAEEEARLAEERAAKEAKLAEEKAAKEAEAAEKARLREEQKTQAIALKEQKRQEKLAEKEARREAKELRKQSRTQEMAPKADQEATDITTQETAVLVKEIDSKTEKDFDKPTPISEDKNHEYVMPEKSEIEKAKENAIADRTYDRSYKDAKTNLTEDELAKTILVEDDFDIDELFEDEK